MERRYGRKAQATEGLDVADIAKLIRRDLREAQGSGQLPADLSFSVRIRRYADGEAIDLDIRGWTDQQIYTTDTDQYEREIRVFTEPASAVLAVALRIHDEYNWDGSGRLLRPPVLGPPEVRKRPRPLGPHGPDGKPPGAGTRQAPSPLAPAPRQAAPGNLPPGGCRTSRGDSIDTAHRAAMHHGDALLVLPTLSAGSVDLVIADPPYNSGGRTPVERTSRTAKSKYVLNDNKISVHRLADFAGDNRDQRSYLAWLTLVLAECLRVTRPAGACLVFTDWRQLPTTSDALQAAGWTWRGVVAWHKPIEYMLTSGGRVSNAWESA